MERLLFRIVEFAAMRVRCGRTLTNFNPARDVMSARCRFRNGCRTASLPLSNRDEVAPEVLDAVSDDVSPADQAVLNADFEAWLETLEGCRL